MGLFEKAGRRFEQFKNEVQANAEEDAEYECRACETRLHSAHEQCPECGADEVGPVETGDADSESAADDRS